ncbi:MAG: DNA translocase FtsK 4TM domain-containing protein [Patescibacteria group bacterium]
MSRKKKKKTKKPKPRLKVFLGNKKEKAKDSSKERKLETRLHPDTKKSVWAIIFLGIAVVLFLASFQKAGPIGGFLYNLFNALFGWGYYLLPLVFLLMAGVFLASERRRIYQITFVGAGLFVLSGLGLIDVIFPGKGGLLGRMVGLLEVPFGSTASIIILIAAVIISIIITLNLPLRIRREEEEEEEEEIEPLKVSGVEAMAETSIEEKSRLRQGFGGQVEKAKETALGKPAPTLKAQTFKLKARGYIAPPLDLLRSSIEKPTAGDLQANANIIKKTLEGFGIPVEMGEINIGPKVTRYTLKPAEGVKLSRITALNQDLSLALAAHPIRIEAPIPGKSLVGIEVPNKAAAVVRLGSLMSYPEFVGSGLLGFCLGRDVSGEPLFADIEKMPHLLIAGSTGAGKSIALHSLIVSLLYKNSPDTLKFILVDPKRVELSIYEGLPHIIGKVITESKKSMVVFRWAIKEMERRYEILLQNGSRDIVSYNKKHSTEPLSYLLIVIDELADLMASYGREVEGYIVRLAQMARATGLHLIVSTQRPSVEVVTGLIKANITSRVALQLPSQVDSRTILDSAGAEKLLGGGDMLYISAKISKPKRIQGAYLSEEEISRVVDFIKKHNKDLIEEEAMKFEEGEEKTAGLGEYLESGDDDELLEEAIRVVTEAKKASASLLQRRLKLGYARAARLLDIMEAKGIIGPGEGAKPREVYIKGKEGFDDGQGFLQ